LNLLKYVPTRSGLEISAHWQLSPLYYAFPLTEETILALCKLRSAPAVLGMSLLVASSALAQLPAPTRTVYKCQIEGKLRYSDEPCVGAQRIDVTPTRGVDRLSGTSRIGNDVAREIRSEQLAKALAPLSGMNAAEFATTSRRSQLSAAAQSECRQLEPAILASEKEERSAAGANVQSTQQELFILRKRYKTLGC
jgi:hypothetical protein